MGTIPLGPAGAAYRRAMIRQCNRSACSEPAAATFGYDYATRTAWLVDVVSEPHPATYDLCHRHADGLTIPMGGSCTTSAAS